MGQAVAWALVHGLAWAGVACAGQGQADPTALPSQKSMSTSVASAPAPAVTPHVIAGDAIDQPLAGLVGDAERGRAVVVNRREGLCLLCHSGPFPEERFQGNLAPSLAGAGARWSAGQLRLRLVDPSRGNPATVMPSYHRVDGLNQVAAGLRGKPLFTAQQVEDVVAFLQTLRSPP